jgi:hypothetical protein
MTPNIVSERANSDKFNGVADFYRSIFPSVGLRALAVFKGGLGAPPTHTFYDTNEDLLEAAETFEKLGKNVYHGCATFKTGISRKGDNALAAKALWIDLDVGPKKPHATQKDAAISVEKFRTALGLQPPHLVKSGGGIHAYFPLAKGITAEQWQRLAATFAACLDHYGVQHDASRTQDIASILRIPGTSNYKTNPAKAVVLLRLGAEEPAGALYAKLKAYATANNLIIGAPTRTKVKGKLQSELIGNKDYPPSYAHKIVKRCAVLREVAESGGDVNYDIWWRAMGVAKHTTEPDKVAEHWTRNRARTGHDKYDWQKTIAEWWPGPTTCDGFRKHSSKCSTCSHPKAKL